MQGNQTNHPPRSGMRYWTRRRQQELEHFEQRQAVLKAQRDAEAKEQRRLRANASARAYRTRRKAGGFPSPKRSKPEKKGNSTIRMRRWREKWRILLAAWDEAIKINKRRDKRVAKGLPPTAKTSAQRAKETRARQAAAREEYLRSQWFSPALSERDAKLVIQEWYPSLDEIDIHTNYLALVAQANGARLNFNRFTIAQAGEDGIEMAKMQRAIFSEVQLKTNTADYLAVLKEAETTTDLKPLVRYGDPTDETWQKNLIVKAVDAAQWRIGNGQSIYEAVLESHKTKEKK